jgi:hypothetical protein
MKDNTVSVRKYGEMKSETLAHADLISLFAKMEEEKMPKALRD